MKYHEKIPCHVLLDNRNIDDDRDTLGLSNYLCVTCELVALFSRILARIVWVGCWGQLSAQYTRCIE